jgi:predicted ATPase with chaperone activity
MRTREVKTFCQVCADSQKLLETAMTKLGFSARAYDRILKVARTIADLAGEEDIRPAHVAEAIPFHFFVSAAGWPPITRPLKFDSRHQAGLSFLTSG